MDANKYLQVSISSNTISSSLILEFNCVMTEWYINAAINRNMTCIWGQKQLKLTDNNIVNIFNQLFSIEGLAYTLNIRI